jgi:glutaconate CoA-transferase, subunit A
LSRSRVATLQGAAELVSDGCRVAFGGLSVYQHPMGFVRELARERRRDLTVVGVLNGPELDLLVGAGCVAKIETSYVGLEQFGLARNFRRAVEAGEVEVEDYSEMVAFDRFRASEDGLPFLATKALNGSDVLKHNPRLKPFECPLTGAPLVAVPPADPEVVVLHAFAADQFGNVLAPRGKLVPQSFDAIVARSCDTVVVTVEHLVDNSYVRERPELAVVAGFRVSAVVEVPWGGHPCHSIGAYTIDEDHLELYVEASRDPATFAEYLDRWVHGAGGNDGYLELLGIERLNALRAGTSLL